MFVYFVTEGGGYGPIKLGKTSNLEEQLAELQHSNPNRLSYLVVIPCATDQEAMILEGALKRVFENSKLGNGWFKGTINMNRIKDFYLYTPCKCPPRIGGPPCLKGDK